MKGKSKMNEKRNEFMTVRIMACLSHVCRGLACVFCVFAIAYCGIRLNGSNMGGSPKLSIYECFLLCLPSIACIVGAIRLDIYVCHFRYLKIMSDNMVCIAHELALSRSKQDGMMHSMNMISDTLNSINSVTNEYGEFICTNVANLTDAVLAETGAEQTS